MNILFIHGAFPGQFVHIAPYLARLSSNRVFFLTESSNSQRLSLSGVEIRRFSRHRDPGADGHPYLVSAELAVLRGQAILKAVNSLLDEGFIPDVIISHAGMGYGLYVKDLLPSVRLISYLEWYASPHLSRHLFDTFEFNDALVLKTRLWPLIQEMHESDELICPTAWQRSQFPSAWQPRIRIIFDGINTSTFYPDVVSGCTTLKSSASKSVVHLSPNEKVLSYAARGMEPLRGFPEFMRAAAFAQQQDSALRVVVAGVDQVFYSYRSSHPSGSWKKALLEELKDQLDLSRLIFTGFLTYVDLIALYRRSDLHCYFTRPYAISWSLFEATACGANLLVNDCIGFKEVFTDYSLVKTANLDSQSSINQAVVEGLSETLHLSRCPPACNLAPDKNSEVACIEWLKLLNS